MASAAPPSTQRGVGGFAPARSIVGRLAGASTLVALVAVTILYVITYSVVSVALTRALASTVNADLAGLVDIYSTSGRAELVTRIDDRQAMISLDGGRAHYLLRHEGRALAGDLIRGAPLSHEASEQGYVDLDAGTTAYARATRLGPGLDLLVARENGRERALLRQLTIAFALGGAAIVAAVYAFAWWRFRRLSGRVDKINAAYRDADEQAIAGLIGERSGDEIGELARHSGVALRRLAGLLEAQRHATDHVAHELRSPLHSLDGRLVDLQQHERDDGDAAAIEAARDDIRGITAMLDALLDIADSEANRGNTAGLPRFDLAETASGLAELYHGTMEAAGLTFEVDIEPGTTMVGEPMQISHLVCNLLENAIKYVPRGGTVRLEVEPGPLLAVSDDGPGIPREVRPFIFDRFRRGVGVKRKPGYGLGLALARAIARRHDLNLTLEDSMSGCRFVLKPAEEPC